MTNNVYVWTDRGELLDQFASAAEAATVLYARHRDHVLIDPNKWVNQMEQKILRSIDPSDNLVYGDPFPCAGYVWTDTDTFRITKYEKPKHEKVEHKKVDVKKRKAKNAETGNKPNVMTFPPTPRVDEKKWVRVARPSAWNGGDFDQRVEQFIDWYTSHSAAHDMYNHGDGDGVTPPIEGLMYVMDADSGVYSTDSLPAASAASVLKYLADPDRGVGSKDPDKPDSDGQNPRILRHERSMFRGIRNIDEIVTASNLSSAVKYDRNGVLKTVVVDKAADQRVSALVCGNTLPDGLETYHDAWVSWLEAANKYADPDGEVDWVGQVHQVDKTTKVCNVFADGKEVVKHKTEDLKTTTEVNRNIRTRIRELSGLNIDPDSKTLYIEDLAPVLDDEEGDPMVTIYRDAGQFALLTGEANFGSGSPMVSGDSDTLNRIVGAIKSFGLDSLQVRVITARLGFDSYEDVEQDGVLYKGVKVWVSNPTNDQIAKHLGVSVSTVKRALADAQDLCMTLGLAPKGWSRKSDEATVVEAYDLYTDEVLGRWQSAAKAAKDINEGLEDSDPQLQPSAIRQVCRGLRKSAGGLGWRYVTE